VLKNDYVIAWPQGYVPKEQIVAKRPVKKTKEEVDRAKLKEKHQLPMPPLNRFFLDDAI